MVFALLAVLSAAPDAGQAPSVVFIGDNWPADVVRDVTAGLHSLPEALQAIPGGPLEFEFHSEAAPFGMGPWTQGHRRFHVFALADGVENERRAQWRLEGLSPEAQAQLWRKRAGIHAVLQRWDDDAHFSTRTSWRSLNGWLRPLERTFTWTERALNLADGAYSRSLGKQSASLDFVTFAEEYFAQADGLPVDDSLECQEFSKVRVLRELLHLPTTEPHCPAFDDWADLEHLSHLEVLLVQASGRRPESLFGHVLMRPVHVEADTVRGPSFESAIQLAAATEANGGLEHLWRGMTGGYRLSVVTLSQRDLEREMLEQEQRSMRRFKLELTRAQARHVLERTWELERRGSFDYQFFTDNCGSGLLWLLQGALGEAANLRARGALFVSPGAVVDDVASAEIDGHPLLTHLPLDFESTCERAQRDDDRRRALEADLPAEWAAVFAAARGPDERQRVHARAKLAKLTRQHPTLAMHEWWALTVRVEQCTADLAERTLHELDLLRVGQHQGPPLDGERDATSRERQFERESHLQRNLMTLDRAEQAEKELAALPRRAATETEREDITRAEQTVANFDALVELHAALVREKFPEVDGHAFLEAEQARLESDATDRSSHAFPASGHWRASAGGGVWNGADGAKPVIVLTTSGLLEELGDQRIRGFQSAVNLRVLDGELWLLPKWGWPEVAQSRFTLFGLRSLMRAPAWTMESVFSQLGFGAELTADTRKGRVLENRSGVSAEALAIVGKNKRTSAFLIFGLGGSAFASWGDAAFSGAAGPSLSASARIPLPGHGGNGLRLEAKYQALVHTGGRAGWLEELEARASADLAVGPVLVSPRVVVAMQRQAGLLLPWTIGASLQFEALAQR